MRYIATTLLAVSLLTGSASTAPLPQDEIDPSNLGNIPSGGPIVTSGSQIPHRKRSPLNIDLPPSHEASTESTQHKRSPLNIELPPFVPDVPSHRRSPLNIDLPPLHKVSTEST
ncbi:uncharacterized protein LY79DRAFT_158321 [Colletotrichum navitas]|uniref:Uncharacterized protein n=1 Tax=Colletotrichum navitas TaxID=681940 RepID=A0AAD8PJ73_9PEZI|nr:uncharacterized protein LY79DRAFT_158321 [Colletotrichum navitas]KAK1564209.1 hypothetical protein LY79DRAFT_158321 [Colletotrichum navitas]